MKLLISILGVCLLISCQQDDGALYAFVDPDTELWGFKTKASKVVIKPQYNSIYEPNKKKQFFKTTTHHFVFKGLNFFAINKKGEKLFEAYWYDNGPDHIEEGLARFIEKRKVGFHDEKGNIVLPAVYDWASYFEDGFSAVCIDCYGLRQNNELYLTSHPLSCAYRKERATTFYGGKWGVINKKGQVIIPLKYDSHGEAHAALKEKDTKS